MRTRRGFALALVLFALVLLTALSGAALFAALQEARIARGAIGAQRSSWAAERAVLQVVATWDAATFDALGPGEQRAVTASTPVGEVPALVRRLSAALFLVQALARDSASGAQRRSAMVVRADVPQLGESAALRTTRATGPLPLVSGADTPPPQWSCPPPRDSALDLDLRAGASDSALFSFGSWSWDRLARWAAGQSRGVDSIEITYAPAGLTLTAERRLGLFVVEGDLVLRGGAEIVGLVLVKGRLVFDGAGGRVIGSAVATEVALTPGTPSGSASVAFSRCVLEAALLSRAPVLPIPSRALMNLPDGVPLR
jgi:hypothetical protein